ncbi:KH domain-containing protein [Candidatus Kaiserbacteria bacterium]|nr:KH domain-containing protein [Candidatus Kaiserbacteria bacterium]
MEQDQKFLEYVVKALVDNPDDVKITRIVDEMGVLLTLSVHKDDMGKVIGRSGQTAKAIRTILRVVGMKNEARVNLKIEEPEGSDRGFRDEGTSDTGGYTHASKARQESPKDKSLDDVIDSLKE